MADYRVPGLGEFMNYPGIINKDEEALNKILLAQNMSKIIDGHAPFVRGAELNAYAAAGIKTDHECTTVKEMNDRLERGMYVQLRDGSACHDLKNLIPAITPYNYRRCLLCSDDRQPRTILEQGHIDNHLRMLTAAGIDPVMSVCMGSLNVAACYRLDNRGALAPGKRADIVLFNNLQEFRARMVFIKGKKVAEDGRYLPPVEKTPISSVRGSMNVKPFTIDNLKMHLLSDRVRAIGIIKDGIMTRSEVITVKRDEEGDFIFDPYEPVAKIAVLERHHSTGKIGLGFLKNYGIQKGAIALSVAHDSHNIICVGVSNEEMYAAVQALIDQEGGFVLVENGEVIASLPLPIAGLMSDLPGEEVAKHLKKLHETAYERLGVSHEVEPVMTLCFMSLRVIPDLKITTGGLFDVRKFDFVPPEAD
jgi:adenine deaminase